MDPRLRPLVETMPAWLEAGGPELEGYNQARFKGDSPDSELDIYIPIK